MGALEWHERWKIITADEGRRLIAADVQPEFGPLFAVAPELYAACRRYLASNSWESAALATEAIRAAVRRAEGGPG